MPTFDVTVDGLTHRIEGERVPTPEEAESIKSGLRGADAYTKHEAANGLPSGLLRAIAKTESGFDPHAKSPTGVRGLMQFTKKTGHAYGLTSANFMDPAAQIAAAGRFMKDNLAAAGGDVRKAVARYGDPKQADYADRVLEHWQAFGGPPQQQAAAQTPSGGGILGPSEAGAATEAPPADQSAAPAGPGPLARRGRALLMQAFIRPAAHANAVLNRWGAGTVTPAEFNQFYAGLGFDPAALPQEYTGPMQALAPLTAFAPEIWGPGAAVAATTGHHDLADGVEALIGGVQATRAVIGLASKAPAAVQKLYAAARTWRRAAAVSELGAEAATAANRAALVEGLAEAPAASTAASQLRDTMGVPAGVMQPDEAAAVAGKALTAVGRHRYEMLPGEDIGVHGAGARLATQVRQKFARAESLAAKAAPLSPTDGDVLSLQRGAADLASQPGLSAAEHELLDQLQHIGGGRASVEAGPVQIGGRSLNPHGTPEERALYARIMSTPEGAAAVEASRAVMVKAHPTAPADLPGTMRLYGALRHAVLNPAQYPVLGARGTGRNALYRLSNELGDLVRSRVSAHPDAFKAWDEATRFVLEEQTPFRRAVEAPLRGRAGSTPTRALGTLLGRDSEPFERLIKNVSPAQRELYQRGTGMQVLMKATEADGKISGTKLKTLWNSLPARTRQIIAARQPEGAAALNDVLAGKAHWGERATHLNAGVDKVTTAIDALIAEQRVARQSPATLRKAAGAARGSMGFFARYHGLRALLSLATGHIPSAMYQGTEWLLMRHPDLFISLVRSDKATPDQLRVLAAGLGAALAPISSSGPLQAAAATVPPAAAAAMQP